MGFKPMDDPGTIPDSYWAATAPAGPETPSFAGNFKAEVAVIGAGFTGLSSALHIAQKRRDVVVLDANEPGWGASGRNNGQVVSALKHEPYEIEEKFGKERGKELIRAVGAGPDLVFSLIERYAIECRAQRKGIITAAHSRRSLDALRKRTEIWTRQGAPLRLLSEDETRSLTGSPFYIGASIDPRGGSINPLAYARGLARAALAEGARIFRDARVDKIERSGGKWLVRLESGEVEAEKIIIGTNAYTGDFWPGLKKTVIPVRTVQVVSRPLSHNLRRTILPEGQIMSDTRKLIVGVRMHPDGRLHLGGGSGTPGEERDEPYAALRAQAAKLFPHLSEIEWEYKWSGFAAVTPDRYPRLIELSQGVATVLGYSGRGIAMATLMGRELARWASGEAGIDELALPASELRPLPYYGLKEILIRGSVLYYSMKERLEHKVAG